MHPKSAPLFPYHLDAASVAQFFPVSVDERLGTEAAKWFLEEYVGISEILERLSLLASLPRPLESVTLHMKEGNAEMSRDITEFYWDYPEGFGGRCRLTTIRACPYLNMRLPLLHFAGDLNCGESTVVHEAGHRITGRAPITPSILEGLAECTVALYAEQFQRPFWDACGTGEEVALLGPLGHFGFDAGVDTAETPLMHSACGWAFGGLFRRLLGVTDEERIENFRKLVMLCLPREDFSYEVGLSDGTSDGGFRSDTCFQTQAWLDACEELMPGFRTHWDTDPVQRSVMDVEGLRMLWFPALRVSPSTPKSPWGVLLSFAWTPNASCGYTRIPWRSQEAPQMQDFDLSPGVCTAQPLILRLHSRGIRPLFLISEGRLNLNPQVILTTVNTVLRGRKRHEWRRAVHRPFAVDVFVPEGERWERIGDAFLIDALDEELVTSSRAALGHVYVLESTPVPRTADSRGLVESGLSSAHAFAAAWDDWGDAPWQ